MLKWIWNWDNKIVHLEDVDEIAIEQSIQAEEETIYNQDNGVAEFDHKPIRGFRPLQELYARFNMAIVELENYFEALKYEA